MQIHMARQPIFRADLTVEAYELLFRAGIGTCLDRYSGEQASSSVIAQSFMGLGLSAVTGGAPAFINFTEDLLLREVADLFPPQSVVVEILETVKPTPAILGACQRLRSKGFTLALDDFVYHPDLEPLIDLVQIIKVDFLLSNADQRAEYVRRFGKNRKMLAEKVETHEEFNAALAMGYNLFQGFFFSKPAALHAHALPENKANAMLLLREASRPGADWRKMEDILKHDVALSYKLLRYINSAFFGLSHEIHSIHQALTMLGQRAVRKWSSLICLSCLADQQPPELMRHSLVRASMCEQLAPIAGHTKREEDLFLLGMFSMLDTIFQMPMQEVLTEMPLADDLREALLGKPNAPRSILEVVMAYERARWDDIKGSEESYILQSETLPGIYYNALSWAEQMMTETAKA